MASNDLKKPGSVIFRLFSKKTRAPGLPPGTLIMEGQQRLPQVSVDLTEYNERSCREQTISETGDFPSLDSSLVSWVNVKGIHDIRKIENIGKQLKLHPLTLEDILNTDHRPKYDQMADYIFVVLKLLSFDDARDEVISQQVSFVLGRAFVASFLEQDDPFDPVRKRILSEGTAIRKMPAGFLFYSLIDLVTDNYYSVVEKIGDRIEKLEEELVSDPAPQILYKINHTKNELVVLRKSIWPIREIINTLEKADTRLIDPSMGIYFRDDYEHIVQIIENTESLRDIVSGMLDIYLSSVNNRMNAVMKVLTIFATIFIPLTFIASIYGMNFQDMPELAIPWAYPTVISLMAIVAAIMLIYFKRKKWM